MKKLILLLLFVSSISFGQIKIEPIQVGWPQKTATDLMVRVLSFETDSKTCVLYWELRNDSVNPAQPEVHTLETLSVGNVYLTEAEFSAWGQSNAYIEDLVLCRLALTRKTD